MIPIGTAARQALLEYLSWARDSFLKGNERTSLCKLFRKTHEPPGILEIDQAVCGAGGNYKDITPHTLRHSLQHIWYKTELI